MKKVILIALVLALCAAMAAPVGAYGSIYQTCAVKLDSGVTVEFATAIEDYAWLALDTSAAGLAQVLLVKPDSEMKVDGSLTAQIHTVDYSAVIYDEELELTDWAYLKSGTVEVRSGKVDSLFENVLDVYESFVLLGTADGVPVLVSYYDVPYVWAENPFSDVSPDDDCYLPVMWALDAGVTKGTSLTTFDPNGTCTRAQVVTFLWRAVNCPEPVTKTNPFRDVKTSDYFYKAVLWAVEEGITVGTSATTFSPDQTCQYGHVLTFLYRTLGEPMPDLTGAENPFGSEYWSEAFELVCEYGLIPEDQDPAELCPRSQIVTFLYYLLPG